jgi:predicted SnoaL-like aldol condensation-catalyzing enzyme
VILSPLERRHHLGRFGIGLMLVIVHGRFSGFGQPVNWIAADILRINDGLLVEHWDVIQDKVTRESSKSGLPMFGDEFRE